MMQKSDQPILNITIPAKHMQARLVRAQETYMLAGRGSLKTTVGGALYCIDMIHEMPRSTGVIVCLSYEHFKLNTKDPLLKGWGRMGFIEGQHFVMYKKPPSNWDRAIDDNGGNDYENIITWYNGTRIVLVSLARLAAANAISAQWGYFDEVKFMSPKKLDEVLPIFRPEGPEKRFEKCNGYLSKFFTTDKLADPAEIDWLLKKRDLMDNQKIADIIPVQLKVDSLKRILADTLQSKKRPIEKQIEDLEQILRRERDGLIFVVEINCYDVLPLLGDKWLTSQKAITKSKRVWDVAFENKDPDKPEESFYPKWDDDVHTYDTVRDEDIDYDKPLIIAADYQHSVAPIPVAQLTRLPGAKEISLNYIDYIYGLSKEGEGLRATVKKLCLKYKYHRTKKVYYVYDHTAIGKRQDADEYCKIVVSELKANGFNVAEVYTGQAPPHFQKYSDSMDWLEHGEGMEQELEIRMHKRRCVKLIKSINNSPATTKNGKTEKDKKYEDTEKYPELDQSTTTHGSDTFDMINDGVIKQKKVKPIQEVVPLAFR